MMENLNLSNQSYSNNNYPDLSAKLSAFVAHAVQPTIGLAVVATNIALLYFYRHSAKARESRSRAVYW